MQVAVRPLLLPRALWTWCPAGMALTSGSGKGDTLVSCVGSFQVLARTCFLQNKCRTACSPGPAERVLGAAQPAAPSHLPSVHHLLLCHRLPAEQRNLPSPSAAQSDSPAWKSLPPNLVGALTGHITLKAVVILNDSIVI